MANAHPSHSFSQQQQQSAPFAAALRTRAPRRRAAAAGWRVACAAALAASTAAATASSTRLESDPHHHRLVSFGAVAERFAHYQQHKRAATAALTKLQHTSVERETALAKQQQQYARFPTRAQQPQQSWSIGALPLPLTTSPTPATLVAAPLVLHTKTIQHEYELQGVVGEGGFGRVHAARHRASDAPVALKRVFKATTTREQFLHEVAILRHVGGGGSAAGVLQLRDAFETPDAYVLVTEFVAGGELFDALLEHGAFDERRARGLLRELAHTLAFLHARHVVHGDLKPENVMLDGVAGVRLVDFGQAFRADEASERARALGSGFGTTAYAAPEFLGKREAGPAADMWALGVVLYIVLCGRHPFDPSNAAEDDEIAARIRTGDFARDAAEWTAMSAPARDLVQRLLAVDPRERITAEQVLAHDWLQRGDAVCA